MFLIKIGNIYLCWNIYGYGKYKFKWIYIHIFVEKYDRIMNYKLPNTKI